MNRRISTVLLIAFALAAGGAAPASAGDGVSGYRTLRVCDPTACYIAWRVVDTDRDGVSDADELAAGTDPRDPDSKPPMEHLGELLLDRRLPTFEYGLAALVLLPGDILKARQEKGIDPLGAFPLHGRKDALTRLGISGDLLSRMGISADRDGFALGLDRPKEKGDLPGVRVSGIEASLISAGKPNGYDSRGGVVDTSNTWGGKTVNKYGDGSKDVLSRTSKGGWRMETYDPSGERVGATESERREYKDGGTNVVIQEKKTFDGDDNLVDESFSESHTFASGATNVYTKTTHYVRDDSGKVVGVVVTESNEYYGTGGTYSKGETKKVCNAEGKQCTESSIYTETPPGGYIDPDQAYSNIVSVEATENALRLRGAAITVVQGWSAPGMEETPEDPRNPSTIILVDEEIGTIFMLAEPTRTAVAQPEGHPDLPNPMRDGDGNPPSGSGSGCRVLCS